ncbi:MAG: CHAT domain-containing protein [Leptolyngbya sp. SIOISBB]|nr:CHAT domain-containing protein [Leptolyngbya sp. SIOISBB]
MGSQLNQIQASQAMGLYRQAYLQLVGIQSEVQALPASSLKVKGLKSIGEVFQITGNLPEAQEVLQASIHLAKQIDDQVALSAAWLSLGNAYRGSEQYAPAAEAYAMAANTATNPLSQATATSSELSLAIQAEHWETATNLLTTVSPLITTLEPSRSSLYAKVNLAASMQKMLSSTPSSFSQEAFSSTEIAQLLSTAVAQAQTMGDQRAEAYALGQLGAVYEHTQQYDHALTLTNQALALAEAFNARDIAYRWQWQQGRIFKAQSTAEQGETAKQLNRDAIAAYQKALGTLKLIRADIVAADPLVQFAFRDNVELVYREFVDLLVTETATEAELQQARQAIEDLQLAELQNFFQSACLDIQPQQINQIDASAAILYPVILSERLVVITDIPGEPLQQHSISISQENLTQTVTEFLQTLNPVFSETARLEISETIYQWLVAPLQTALQKNNIETLVFILDGPLRNIPISALHTGDQYLIERFNIALTPGLQLLPPERLSEQNINVLAGAITKAHQGLPALPGVEQEIEKISGLLPTTSFINEDFIFQNIKDEFLQSRDFPIIHLATHGQFSSDVSETYLVGWNEPLQIKDFQILLREQLPQVQQPIELLVLSACQTAEGDSRAALGLAGFAVRSGAKSTLATLWAVNDASTGSLISEFYQQLAQEQRPKANALREAQISMINSDEFSHPYYWAPFVLVGNWL